MSLWEKSNGYFLVYDICQTLWFFFNTWTIYRLLALKVMDQRREWRRDDDITFTAHRGDIEGISETGIKFVKDTTSSQNGDNISKNYSFASGRNNINGSKLGLSLIHISEPTRPY